MAGVSQDQVAQQARLLQIQAGETILIGSVGIDAQRSLEQILRTQPDLDVQTAQIPLVGDRIREQERLLEASGLRCGARFEPAPSGQGWLFVPFGDCSPKSPPLPTAPASTTSNDEAPPTQVVIGPSAERVAEIAERQLEIRPQTQETWNVVDGAGVRLSATSFAKRVDDSATLYSLERERDRAVVATRWFRIGGLVTAGSAAIPLLTLPPNSTGREDQLWTSLFLVTTGTLAYIVAPRAIEGANKRQKRPDNYYTLEQAQDWVERHNTTLKQQLEPSTAEEVDKDEVVP